MTAPNPLDEILLPFSLLWRPTRTTFHFMELSKGKNAGGYHQAEVPEATLMVYGQWTGRSRARLQFSPGGESSARIICDMPTNANAPTIIPPMTLAVTAPGAFLLVDVYSPSQDEVETAELILQVVPTPYSS